jgi:hypothetical protein
MGDRELGKVHLDEPEGDWAAGWRPIGWDWNDELLKFGGDYMRAQAEAAEALARLAVLFPDTPLSEIDEDAVDSRLASGAPPDRRGVIFLADNDAPGIAAAVDGAARQRAILGTAPLIYAVAPGETVTALALLDAAKAKNFLHALNIIHRDKLVAWGWRKVRGRWRPPPARRQTSNTTTQKGTTP